MNIVNSSLPKTAVIKDILFDEDAALKFISENGIFLDSLDCHHYGGEMRQNLRRQTFRSTKMDCRKAISYD